MNRSTVFYRDDKLHFNHAVIVSPKDTQQYHTHDTLELILFLAGDVSYIVEGEEYRINPGDIAIVAPFTYHRIRFRSEVNYERYDILLDGSVMPQTIAERLFDGGKLVLQKASARSQDVFRRLIYYCEEYGAKDIQPLTAALMSELMHILVFESDASKQSVTPSQNDVIRRAVAYIDRNLTTIRTLDELYAAVELSKCQFHRIFLGAFGITPMEYIRDKRLALACKELHMGKKPSEVYLKCGFSSYTAFYRAYREKYGYVPSKEIEQTYPTYKVES